MDYSTLSTTRTSAAGPAPALASGPSAQDTQDRFLKLLVAQMKNQDPMNPMDNAQVTSQMAQIQTVSGISSLNTTVQALTSQFTQMQSLQGVSLVGHDVTVPGNRLAIANNQATGRYKLDGPADAVKLEVLGPAGQIVDTIQLGAQSAGTHDLKWPAAGIDPASGLTFRISATQGGVAVKSTPYCNDRVVAVQTTGGQLQLELEHLGRVDYSAVISVN